MLEKNPKLPANDKDARNKLLKRRRQSIFRELLVFLLEIDRLIKPDNFEFRKRKILTIVGAVLTLLLLLASIVSMSLQQANTIYLFENNHTDKIGGYRLFG
jgi:hypothetical protein